MGQLNLGQGCFEERVNLPWGTPEETLSRQWKVQQSPFLSSGETEIMAEGHNAGA